MATETMAASVILDEIKVEPQPRWDVETNKIIGIAHEDADKIGLALLSIEEVNVLCKAVKDGTVRLAVEATVAAIGLLKGNACSYTACPIFISGTCKTEDAVTHTELIQTIINACNTESSNIPGQLYSIASDSEVRHGALLAILMYKKQLFSLLDIYKYIGPLQLLNKLVGNSNVTSNKDPRHTFKHCCMAIICKKGIAIFSFVVSSDTISGHLHSEGLALDTAHLWLNPNNKQDVSLALNLLQVVHPKGGSNFMSKVLYQDHQIMIKNVFFCIAKAKVDKLCAIGEELSSKDDHINPVSWLGDVNLKGVLPVTAWNEGRSVIEKAYTDYLARKCFACLETSNGNFLVPNGRQLLGQLDPDNLETVDPELGEDDTEPDAEPIPLTLNISFDDLDIKDHIAIEEGDRQVSSFTSYLKIEGKHVYKAQALRSTDQLGRVAGLTCFTMTSDSDTSIVSMLSVFGRDHLFIGEPLSTLVQSDSCLFLALVEITSIQYQGVRLHKIPASALLAESMMITSQILALHERSLEATGETGKDWEWTGLMGKTLKVAPGHIFHEVNLTMSMEVPFCNVFYFATVDLQSLTTTLHNHISESLSPFSRLPSIAATVAYLYRSQGHAAFACDIGSKTESYAKADNVDFCNHCWPVFKLDHSNGPHLLKHMGSHILCDNLLDGSEGIPVAFNYQMAATAGNSTPCTNVPMPCSTCAATWPAEVVKLVVWHYSMVAYIHTQHVTSSLAPPLLTSFQISKDECGMVHKLIQSKGFAKAQRSRKVYQAPKLRVSDAHCASQITMLAEELEEAEDDAEVPVDPEAGDNNCLPMPVVDNKTGAPVDNATADMLGEDDGTALDGPKFVDNTVVSHAGRKSCKHDIGALLRVCKYDMEITQKEKDNGVAIKCSDSYCDTKWDRGHLVVLLCR
ncbi:hypothetical protein CONPUDRAFT_70145 [Coniophora puteana RWD-64-598 SS2]|uniref:Uncharacterized protein n=1 Tax=Coniophora puteana (strain RWD-64-598) TaxID=741705 RepID=A0A5M3N1X1_CONPW|nr:uncharacterized protein CONPUDRAFT_70145 [Coniophora puteana RWD-64-598 SS2]EIW85306.1 hypothetical protein CONPUDRAFT_70145 [Coniophora puteana RWD-64-598 SS2]